VTSLQHAGNDALSCGARDRRRIARVTSEAEGDTLVGPDRVQIDLSAMSLEDQANRYVSQQLLGQGGMGEVRLCRDRRLGRRVAMKGLRPHFEGHRNIELRFLQEAFLQAQLEHPSIVPVYEVGRGPNGHAYFTMKCVHGLTLEQILSGLAKAEPAIVGRFSRRKLLRALASVCLAVDFAHSRGVIHRDLKPGNLMLGDFGEVYVLDWGVAKLTSVDAVETPIPSPRTAEGAVVGTPGYMAPEQLSSDRGALAAAIDIYALGAILFEILTLESLHNRLTMDDALRSTLAGVDARPSARAAELMIPPELDAICVRATAMKPEDRFPTARALAEAIERFLDGDLDLERRKQAAKELVSKAEATLDSELGEHERRSQAMKQLSNALALDPTNADAVSALAGVLLNPPASLPPEAESELLDQYRTSQREAAKVGSKAMLAFLVGTLLFVWMGIQETGVAIAALVMILAAGIAGFLDSRAKMPGMAGRFTVFLSGAIAIAIGSRVAGPLLFAPMLILGLMVPIALTSSRAQIAPIVITGVATIAIPFALELAHVLSPSYVFSDAMMCVVPHLAFFRETPTLVTFAVVSIGTICAVTTVCARIFATHLDAARRLRLHEWYLRRLIHATPHGTS
jgi:eukaryotic-like serine/threonine-protein kinase